MWTNVAGNHPKGVEYGTISFIGTSLAAVAGFVSAVTLLVVLFQYPSRMRRTTLPCILRWPVLVVYTLDIHLRSAACGSRLCFTALPTYPQEARTDVQMPSDPPQ